jgi:hypothetical protein
MEEAPENGKESSHSAHSNGMNESVHEAKLSMNLSTAGWSSVVTVQFCRYIPMLQQSLLHLLFSST